jgi:colanic acid/amylovoran biosynthesis protein
LTMNHHKKKISIVNAHWNNRGDEAALLALLEQLRKHTDSEITIIFKDDRPISQFPKIRDVDYYSAKFKARIWDIWLAALSGGLVGVNNLLKKTVRTLRDSEFIIYSPGGSVINDRFFWRKQMEYLVPFICAKLYRIPLFVAAPSMGPFDKSRTNLIRTWLLRAAKVICVREAISKEYLGKIGVHENVRVTGDLAFLSTIDQRSNENKLNGYAPLKRYLESYEKVVGIVLTDFSWHVKYGKDSILKKKIHDTFTHFISKLVTEEYGILFIPQLFGNQNDHDYMSEYMIEKTFIMTDTMDSYFQQHIISKLYAVVSMRYHPLIFAAKLGTPFVSVVYEEKTEGFIKQAGLTKYSLSLEDLSFDKLYEKFTLIEHNYDQLRQILQENVGGLVQKAKKNIILLKTIKF